MTGRIESGQLCTVVPIDPATLRVGDIVLCRVGRNDYREETLAFDEPRDVMTRFADWLAANVRDRPIFISDNNGFDWQFINWYFHHFVGHNPFGYSSQNLRSLYKGLVKDTGPNFKRLRKTRHTHHPVDDAKGDAEALLHMKDVMGLEIKL